MEEEIMPSFSTRSLIKLESCEPDLIHLFKEVIKEADCTILEGHRSPERQLQLFNEGRSRTMNSNHLHSPSRAVDVMPYPIQWGDLVGQREFAELVFKKAEELGYMIEDTPRGPFIWPTNQI